MSRGIEKLQAAQERAMAIRPKVGGFPHLAEVLRQAGVRQHLWYLPSCQSVYLMDDGPVVVQGTPLVTGMLDIPPFNREGLIAALRTDQAGKSTFQEFLVASWRKLPLARRQIAEIDELGGRRNLLEVAGLL